MTMRYGAHFQSRQTPQSEPIPGTAQVPNHAGGYAYALDDWKRLDRFLVLGSEGGTYYVKEHELTVENAQCVLRCVKADARRTIDRIVEMSDQGRIPKNDTAVFALAIAAGMGDDLARKLALDALPAICRIGTHLFQFLEAVQGFRGWGRGLRKAVARWYTSKEADALALQLLKYKQRGGWSHRDVMRLAHPASTNPSLNALFRYVTDRAASGERAVIDTRPGGKGRRAYGAVDYGALPRLVRSYEELQDASCAREATRTIEDNDRLTWEMVPSEFLGDAKVWEALLLNIPMMAMIRNLGRMTANGCLKPMSPAARVVTGRLTDAARITEARVHPIAILGALMTYKQGHGILGGLSWDPLPRVCDALEEAFYLAFRNVEPCGKRMLLALDVSGSMGAGAVAGMPGLTPAAASAALALVTARTEHDYHIMGFASEFRPLKISKSSSLEEALRKVTGQSFGGTDCALPMLWATTNKVGVDAFVVYTDSETWAGDIHPTQALKKYRDTMGIPAKLIVVGMTATDVSIADPDDGGMMDVVGFDTATPGVISDFVREQ